MSETSLQEIQRKLGLAGKLNLIDEREHGQIAAIVSEGRTSSVETRIGSGHIVTAIGDLDAANAFMDIVKSESPTSPFRHMKEVIVRGDFDVSAEMAQAAIWGFASDSPTPQKPLTTAQAQALINLSKAPAPVDIYWVIDALGHNTT